MTRARPAIRLALVAAVGPLLLGSSAAPLEPFSPAAPLVRLPFPQEDGSLTPYTFELGYPLMTLVYDTLLWRDAAGTPAPWLARSIDTSPDGRDVTLRLAEGVRWHDGAPLTSADVAFTFAFVADRHHPRFTSQLDAVERVETPDPLTLVITLRQPSPGFADQPLADLPILPAHLWRALRPGQAAPDGRPVGSGPYRLVDHKVGQSYRFEANADYFRGPPAVGVLDVPIVTDAEATLVALERLRVDMIPASLPVSALARLDRLGVRVATGPSYLGTVLLFNARRPPFDQPMVRRAVSQALDLDQILRNIGGDGVAAQRGYLHPESPWASPEILQVPDDSAARITLGRLELKPVQILTLANDPTKLEAARQVALALQRVGFPAEAKGLQPHELSSATGGEDVPPTFDLAISSSPPLASYDPDFLRRIFGSTPREAPLNQSGYASAAFDAAAQRTSTTTDPSERRVAVADELRLLAADVPVVPLFFSDGAFAFRPAVYDGWLFVKGAGILDKRSFLDPPIQRPPVPGADRPGSTTSGSPLGWAAAGVLAAALALVGGTMARDRWARR